MRILTKIFVATVAAAALVTAAIAATNVVGKWNGKVQVDESKIPAAKTPNEKKMRASMISMMKKTKITLNLKSDKTFALTIAIPEQKKPMQIEGKWSQAGNVVTATATKENGKATTGEDKKPVKIYVSKDGKSMSMTPPGAGNQGKIVFTR